jgi:rod shape determining protein RodA
MKLVDRRPGLRFHADGWLLLGVAALCVLGLFVLYSASGQNDTVLLRQSIRILVGFAVMVAFTQVPPAQFARWAPWLYAVGCLLLAVVLIVGSVGGGAKRWLDLGIIRFQPSEMMKLAVPLAVAALLSSTALPPNASRIAIALALLAVPAALVMKQPDLGTALIIVSAGAFTIFFAGLAWRYLLAAAAIAIAALPLGWFVMHDYQRRRVLTLLDPESDPLGAGYHIIQSKIAVGSGGWAGKGWLLGTQSQLEFIPEHSTDFIFAVFCEEFGLLGVLALTGLYVLLIGRGCYIAANAQDSFGRIVAGALTMTLFMYVFVNMSMVIGQLPIVGIPLPLVSYGGTSMVTLMAGFGILASIHTHRRMLSGA